MKLYAIRKRESKEILHILDDVIELRNRMNKMEFLDKERGKYESDSYELAEMDIYPSMFRIYEEKEEEMYCSFIVKTETLVDAEIYTTVCGALQAETGIAFEYIPYEMEHNLVKSASFMTKIGELEELEVARISGYIRGYFAGYGLYIKIRYRSV